MFIVVLSRYKQIALIYVFILNEPFLESVFILLKAKHFNQHLYRTFFVINCNLLHNWTET